MRYLAIVTCLLAGVALAHEGHPSTQPADQTKAAAEMATAGKAFLESLSAEQQQKATFAFDNEERQNWAFVPKARNGIPFKELSPAQRELAVGLLKSGLSQRGFEKADAIMNQIELILKELENGAARRDPGLYYVTLFGKPEPSGTWGWRVEGHHVAFNFTIAGGKALAGAPNFLGSNPANVRSGPKKGTRILGAEEDLGRKLVTSLSEDQRKLAVISETAPRDITTGNTRKITPSAPAGIPAEKLTEEQRKVLLDLVAEYANRLRPEMTAEDLKKITLAGFDKIHFAWAGALEPGKGHYYRIQGPTFMIEYDNTQNSANHVHSVWRDPSNDFGEDMLKKHYEETKHHDHQ